MFRFAVVLAVSLSSSALFGAPPPAAKPGRFEQRSVDKTAETAAAKYGLDERQKEELSLLLDERGKEFRRKADELAALWKDFEVRRGKGEKVDLTEFFERVHPLSNEVSKFEHRTAEMVRARFVDPARREAFDADIAKGENPLIVPRPPAPPPGSVTWTDAEGRTVVSGGREEQEWRQWLAKAARAAKMTDEQKEKALGLLELAEKAAAEYRKAKAADFKKTGADLAAASSDKDADPAKRRALRQAAIELRLPILEIGRRWRADVIELLTPEQRKLVH